jgi:hypothetical protein
LEPVAINAISLLLATVIGRGAPFDFFFPLLLFQQLLALPGVGAFVHHSHLLTAMAAQTRAKASNTQRPTIHMPSNTVCCLRKSSSSASVWLDCQP